MELSNRWCLTTNSADDETEEVSCSPGGRIGLVCAQIKALFESGDIVYAVASYERGDDNGRFHLQGYLQTKERHRRAWVANRIEETHLEAQRAKEDFKAQKYALGFTSESKFTSRKAGWVGVAFELGEFKQSKPGQRNELHDVREGIADGSFADWSSINLKHPTVAAKHSQWIERCFAEQTTAAARDYHRERLGLNYKAKCWQHWLYRYLTELEANDRQIVFVVDPPGRAGKSTFVKHFELHAGKKVSLLRPARKADLAQTLDSSADVLFIDIPRGCSAEFLGHVYVFLEEVMDGSVMAPKYNSTVKRFKPMHVVVFMNITPDTGGEMQKKDWRGDTIFESKPAPLTYDRYLIWNVGPNHREDWAPEHVRFGATCPPFKTFNVEMQPIPYHPPLVTDFGSEFSSDVTGDGPGPVNQWVKRDGAGWHSASFNPTPGEDENVDFPVPFVPGTTHVQVQLAEQSEDDQWDPDWPSPEHRYSYMQYNCTGGSGGYWCMRQGHYVPRPDEGENFAYVYWKYGERTRWFRLAVAPYEAYAKRSKEPIPTSTSAEWPVHFPPTYKVIG